MAVHLTCRLMPDMIRATDHKAKTKYLSFSVLVGSLGSYPDVVATQLYIADGVSVMWSTSGHTAVVAHSRVLSVAVVEPVLVVKRAAPGPGLGHLHQQVSRVRRGLLQVRLDV